MRPVVAALLVALVYLLHQDFWFWRTARPVVFGILPIGLFYHAAYTVASAVLMWGLVKQLWPAHLESTPELKLGPTSTPDVKLGPTTPTAPGNTPGMKPGPTTA